MSSRIWVDKKASPNPHYFAQWKRSLVPFENGLFSEYRTAGIDTRPKRLLFSSCALTISSHAAHLRPSIDSQDRDEEKLYSNHPRWQLSPERGIHSRSNSRRGDPVCDTTTRYLPGIQHERYSTGSGNIVWGATAYERHIRFPQILEWLQIRRRTRRSNRTTNRGPKI